MRWLERTRPFGDGCGLLRLYDRDRSAAVVTGALGDTQGKGCACLPQEPFGANCGRSSHTSVRRVLLPAPPATAQWQESLPESAKLAPATGMNVQS
jgi:hypothetical protein